MEKFNDVFKLSWEDTYRAMAKEQEDWKSFDQTTWDGLEKFYGDSPLLERDFIEKDDK